MEYSRRGKFTKRLQICLTPTQYSAFREIASKKFQEGDARTDGVDESSAGRQAILDWIRNNGSILQDTND